MIDGTKKFLRDDQKKSTRAPGPKELVLAYIEAYERRYPGRHPKIVWGKHAAMASALLRQDFSFDDLYNLLGLYFLIPDRFFLQCGHAFEGFVTPVTIAKLQAAAAQRRPPAPPRQPLTEAQIEHRRAVRRQNEVLEAEYAAEQLVAYFRSHQWIQPSADQRAIMARLKVHSAK